MQNQKVHQQHPILNLETGGTVVVSSQHRVQPTAQKTSLFFGSSLLIVGLIGGIAIGTFTAERKVSKAQEALKIEQMQRAATHQQIEKFCSENLGGSNGR